MNELRWSKYSELKAKEFYRHNKLYEGLIVSYSPKDTIGYFVRNILKKRKDTNILKNSKYKLKITYFFIDNENSSLPYITINTERVSLTKDISNDHKYIFEDQKQTLLDIEKWMNVCGWYKIDTTEKGINKTLVTYRAKFDVEVKRSEWPVILYHVTPSKNLERIQKQGLVPRSRNKKIEHEDHIYLYNFSDPIELDVIAKELGKYSKEEVVLKVHMDELPSLFKLFADPDLVSSYFTLDNINPRHIEIERFIKI